MFQIRANQVATMRRKKIGDALIVKMKPLGWAGRWDENGETIILQDRGEQQSRVAFDPQGFIDRFSSPLGRTWHFANLPDGKPAQITGPSGHQFGMNYYPDGSLATVATSARAPLQLQYALPGLPAATVYADGTAQQIEYMPWRAPARLSDRNGSQVGFTYDEHQRLTSLTDGNGQTTRFGYNRWTRPDATVLPNGATESYTYNDKGHVATITQGDVAIALKCNDKGRPVELAYNDGTKVEYAYDGKGRVTKAAQGELSSEFAYNEAGLLLEEKSGELTHRMSYDAVGRLAAVEMLQGDAVVSRFGYRWDADSRLAGYTDWNGREHLIEYAAGDRGSVLTTAGGVRMFTGVTPGGKLESVNVTSQGRSLYALGVGYDGEERVATQSDSVFGERTFAYDAESRVLAARANRVERSETFAYDGAGNLVGQNGVALRVDAANQLVAAGDEEMEYDSRGNLTVRHTRQGDWVYRWNARNQMIAAMAPGGDVTLFTYDAFGRRLSKRTRTRETRFRWAGETLMAEVSIDLATRTVTRQEFAYLPGTHTLLATRVDGAVHHAVTDSIGTPRALVSDAGELSWAAEPRVYGGVKEAAGTTRQPLRLPGQYFDAETGLHYNRFRYYSPEWGRYVSRDPIGFAGGPNEFAYCGGNPLGEVDPGGLLSKGWAIGLTLLTAVAVGAACVVAAPAIAAGGLVAAIAVGAVAGATVSAVGAAAMSDAANGHVVWPCVAKAAVIGALGGGAIGAVAALAAGVTAAAFAIRAGVGAVVGMGNYAANVFWVDPTQHFSAGAMLAYGGITAVTAGLTGMNFMDAARPDAAVDAVAGLVNTAGTTAVDNLPSGPSPATGGGSSSGSPGSSGSSGSSGRGTSPGGTGPPGSSSSSSSSSQDSGGDDGSSFGSREPVLP